MNSNGSFNSYYEQYNLYQPLGVSGTPRGQMIFRMQYSERIP